MLPQAKFTEIQEAFRKLQLPKNAVAYVSSSFMSLGIPDFTMPQLIDYLQNDVFPEGTIIMPTFTFRYRWARFGTAGRRWDRQSTKSESGVLTETFRKSSNVYRTDQPIHSCALWGKEVVRFQGRHHRDSFGSESPYPLMQESDAVNVLIGTEHWTGFTFYHYVEQVNQVPYRTHHLFPGVIVDQGIARLALPRCFVIRSNSIWDILKTRHKRDSVRMMFQQAGADFEEHHPPVKYPVGQGCIKVVRSQQLYDFVSKRMQEDPYYLTDRHWLQEAA